ncbi:MAG: 8-oxo-dGTP diphosphatase MutT [Negativicutes bacterium]|nr:8-oxo-dGTP diphosphatase MutT [Negativicutes bacterium]
MLDVTAAVIIRDDTVFIAKKGPHGRFAHLWEFPGGKIEDGEKPEECIVREIQEEFAITIAVAGFFAESIHTFPEGQIRVLAYYCRWTGGEISAAEHEDYRWVPIGELDQYCFAPADIPLAAKLMQERSAPAG